MMKKNAKAKNDFTVFFFRIQFIFFQELKLKTMNYFRFM